LRQARAGRADRKVGSGCALLDGYLLGGELPAAGKGPGRSGLQGRPVLHRAQYPEKVGEKGVKKIRRAALDGPRLLSKSVAKPREGVDALLQMPLLETLE